MSIKDALEIIHNPSADIPIDDLIPGGTHPARVKLLKEELIAFQTGMVSLRSKMKTSKAEPCIESGGWRDDFLSMFPYELTNAQSRVESEINKAIDDLKHSRLSEGDKILKVLNIKIKNILSIEASLRKMIPSINRQRKKNIKERLNHFLENPSEEIEKEIALQITVSYTHLTLPTTPYV